MFALNITDSVYPDHTVYIKTKDGNIFKGLLLSVNDSSVSVYPGKWKEWEKGFKYQIDKFSCYRIEEIKLKAKGRMFKGMAIGVITGVLPLVAGNRNESSSPGVANILFVSVPAGIISGAIIGWKSCKKYLIKGKKELFDEFRNTLK